MTALVEPPIPPGVQATPLWRYGAQVMLEQLERLLAREAGTRVGEDPEELHKMRVASRRLRAALRVFGSDMEKEWGQAAVAPLLDDVRTLAAALGIVRDLDVFAETLAHEERVAPPGDRAAVERLHQERLAARDVAQQALHATLDGEAMARLRGPHHDQLEALAHGERDEAAEAGTAAQHGKHRHRHGKHQRHGGRARADEKSAEACAAPLVVQRLKRLRRLVKQIGKGKREATAGAQADASAQAASGHQPGLARASSDELHQVRIMAKRLRYEAEFFAPVLGQPARPLIEQATALQDALGVVHDRDVAQAVLWQEVEQCAEDPARESDCGAIVRLIHRFRPERAAALTTAVELWESVPTASQLREQLTTSEASSEVDDAAHSEDSISS